MKSVRGALALTLACVAWPLCSAESEAEVPDLASMSDQQIARRLAEPEPGDERKPCAIALPLTKELKRRHPVNEALENPLLFARVQCAVEQERYADGLRDLKALERRAGTTGPTDRIGLFLAAQLEDGSETLARLRGLAASGALAEMSRQTLGWASDVVRRDELVHEYEAFAYDVATSDLQSQLDADVQPVLAYAALAHAARLPDPGQVDDLLGQVRSPYGFIDLLALRDYEPIWPQVERHAGDNLARLSDAYVAWTAERLADDPEDRDWLSEYANALLYAGRFQELVEVAESWLGDRRFAGEIEEGDGWALNVQAYAYDALGRPGEADRVFDRLAQLSPDAHPWVVNFLINRQARLTRQGRWQEAIAASEIARPATDVYGTPYARMLVASYRACALHKAGRLAESAAEFVFVGEHFVDAPTAGGQALLCADRGDEAARRLASVLADETKRNTVLEDLQDERFSFYRTAGDVMPSLRDLILARPELREKALAHARLLPDRFVPISHIRREQLAEPAETD